MTCFEVVDDKAIVSTTKRWGKQVLEENEGNLGDAISASQYELDQKALSEQHCWSPSSIRPRLASTTGQTTYHPDQD